MGLFSWVETLCNSQPNPKPTPKPKPKPKPNPNPKPGKKSEELKWGGQKAAPKAEGKLLSEASEEQRKHALNVAVATTVAAEAAVASARAAAEVVRLTCASMSNALHHKELNPNVAATILQSAFRGYLAKKALRALKGLVKLQAIIRGQAVRRQTITVLQRSKGNSISAVQDTEKRGSPSGKELEPSSRRNWDRYWLSKEDIESEWLRKQEAATRRERMLRYSYSHRERLNPNTRVESGGRRSWLDQWTSNWERSNTLKHINMSQNSMDGEYSPILLPRRSLCNPLEDRNSELKSSHFPSYMAVTESAKAKARSFSTPRETCLGNKFQIWSSNNIQFWSSYDGKSFRGKAKISNSKDIYVNTNSYDGSH